MEYFRFEEILDNMVEFSKEQKQKQSKNKKTTEDTIKLNDQRKNI